MNPLGARNPQEGIPAIEIVGQPELSQPPKPNFQIGGHHPQDVIEVGGGGSSEGGGPMSVKEKRLVPISHPVANTPICIECQVWSLTQFIYVSFL